MSDDPPVTSLLTRATTGAKQPVPALPTADVAGGAVRPRAAGRGKARVQAAGWWRTWRARFGLAEMCGTLAAVSGFAAGYLAARSLLAAAGLATLCEAIGFYGCVGGKTAAAASRAAAHLAGFRRLAARTWHAVTQQLASCAAAEALDGFLVRPGCLAGAAWLVRPLPGGVWLGFAAGKAAVDVAWHGMEATARRGVARSLAVGQPATPYLRLEVTEWTARSPGTPRARRCFWASTPAPEARWATRASLESSPPRRPGWRGWPVHWA